jgi:hypothetical protein
VCGADAVLKPLTGVLSTWGPKRFSNGYLMDSGCAVALSQVIKTRSETARFSQIYIDMTEDAAIVYNKGGFFEGVLTRLIKRLRELGVWVNDKPWYWVLKGDYKFGVVIEIE